MTPRELKSLAELIASVAAGRTTPEYRPTILDAGAADLFDESMVSIGNPARAWRGTAPKPEPKQRGATKAQLAHRALVHGLCVHCGDSLARHTTETMRDCATGRS